MLIALLGIRNVPIYSAMGGFVWLAFDASGIHPTIAGVILGLLTPARSWVSDDRLHAILDRVSGLSSRRALERRHHGPEGFAACEYCHAGGRCLRLRRLEIASASLGRFCDRPGLRVGECRRPALLHTGEHIFDTGDFLRICPRQTDGSRAVQLSDGSLPLGQASSRTGLEVDLFRAPY